MHKHLENAWKKPDEAMAALQRQRLIRLRKEGTVLRLERPTRPGRARVLGYKAKQGVITVRVRIDKGGRKRPKQAGGRKPGTSGRFFTLGKSIQHRAEEKACRKYRNMETLGSYWIAEDGKHAWYEVILADRAHPAVKSDKALSSSSGRIGKTFRGLTSAGKKSRGMRHRGKTL